MEPKLILTGFMATGKSVVGRRAAERLGWRFIDTDRALVARAGKPIAQIFVDHGEAHFRRLEREVIAELAGDAACAIVATGGGALADDSNYAVLKRAGVIVCLSARPEVIEARVTRSNHPRPKLIGGNKPIRQRIEELLIERQAAYARAAFAVDTSDRTIDEVVDEVLAGFAAHRANRCEAFA